MHSVLTIKKLYVLSTKFFTIEHIPLFNNIANDNGRVEIWNLKKIISKFFHLQSCETDVIRIYFLRQNMIKY